jgi:hypothetical protein
MNTPRMKEAWESPSRTADGFYLTTTPMSVYARSCYEEGCKLERELTTVTAQRDRLIKAVEPLEYWRDISECDCSSPLPQGGCLRCDLNRVLKTTNPNEP